MAVLLLKRASASRPSGEWNDNDYDVLADGAVVGRIFKANASPVGSPVDVDARLRAPQGPHADTRLCRNTRGRDGGVRQELAAAMSKKRRRTYQPRVFDGRVIMPDEIERIHKEILEFERIEAISDPMRELIEDLWPELLHKLPPKKPSR
jgi:hypothetical protein